MAFMNARDDVLTRLRKAHAAPVALPDLRAPGETPDDAIARFVARAGDVGIQVGRVPEQAWVDTAVSELGRRTVRSVAIWDDPMLLPLAAALGATGIEVVRPDHHTADRLAHIDAGITTADYGIAVSGTLLLGCGAARPRSTSLLPPLHVAVIPESSIVPSLAHVFARVTRPLPSVFTFITGPSRSADIEHTPVRGAHGPIEVIVYLIVRP